MTSNIATRRPTKKVIALIALTAVVLLWGWLLTRQPSPEQIVTRAAEAILRNDASALWELLHPREKELLDEPRLRELLHAIHTEFPSLRETELPYLYFGVSPAEYKGDLVCSLLWQVNEQGRLTPVSSQELKSLISKFGEAYVVNPLSRPPTVVRLPIFFSNESEQTYVYAGSLVPFVAELSIATGKSVEQGMQQTFWRADVDRVLIANNIIRTRNVRTVELEGGRKYFGVGK